MRPYLRHFLVVLVSLLLAGCSAAAPAADSHSDPPSITLPAPTAATSTAPTETLPTPAADTVAATDACLQGIWKMSDESFAEYTDTLLPLPNFIILSGMITLTFYDDLYIYSLDNLTLRFYSTNDNYIQGTGSVSASGSYSTSGGMISFNNTSTSDEITEWQAMINGELTTYPGNPPAFNIVAPGNGAYSCTATTLTIDTTGTANTEMPLEFNRID